MLARRIVCDDNKTVGYTINYAVAEESIRITYSAYPDAIFDCSIDSIVVRRKGFDPVRFKLELVEIYSTATHL